MATPFPKTIHILPSLHVGGAEIVLLRFLEALPQQERKQHTVVSLKTGQALLESFRKLNIRIECLNIDRWRDLWRTVRLHRILREERPQIVSSWLYKGDLIAFPFAKLFSNAKIVWNVRRSFIHPTGLNIPERIITSVLRYWSTSADRLIFNSESARITHGEYGYNIQKSVVIQNGVDTERYRPRHAEQANLRKKYGLPPKVPLIGYLARYHPIKGHDLFLRATKQMLAEHSSPIGFVLVGRDINYRNRRLKEAITNLFGEHTAHLTLMEETLTPEEVIPCLDIVTLTSHSEGCPNLILEAMACGVPCVATDVGDVRHLLKDLGTVVPPNDPEGLAVGWRNTLSLSPDKKMKLTQQLRECAAKHYAHSTFVNRYREALLEVL